MNRVEIIREAHWNVKIFRYFLKIRPWLKETPAKMCSIREFVRSLRREEKEELIKAFELHSHQIKLILKAIGWRKTVEVILSGRLEEEYRRRDFVEKIGRKGYEDPKVEFPSLFLEVPPQKQFQLGRVKGKRVIFSLPDLKDDIIQDKIGLIVLPKVDCVISPGEWEPFFGRIFQFRVVKSTFEENYFVKEFPSEYCFLRLTPARRIANFLTTKTKDYKKIRLEPMEKVISPGSERFFITAFSNKRKKKIRIAVRVWGKGGKKIRMEPEGSGEEFRVLNFFEIGERGEKRFLKSYLLFRRKPFLKLIERAK